MSEVPDWVTSVPGTPAVHDQQSGGYQWQQVSQEQVASLRKNLIQSVISAVVEIISGFLPFTRPAAEFLGGIFNDLFGLLGNPTGLGTGSPSLSGGIKSIPILGPLLSVGGTILSALLGRVPTGQLTTETPNRLDDGDFPVSSIPEHSGGWWVNLDFSVDNDSTGVAEITADGTLHQLVSGADSSDGIGVGPGQNLTVQINVWHLGATFTGTGPPVVLRLLRFNDGVALAPVELITHSPGVTTTTIPGVVLTGTYKVPAGVTEVQVLVEVNENARGGIFRFDKGRLFSTADMSVFPGVQGALQAADQKVDEILKGIAGVAKGIPILDKIGVDDAMLLLASWQPGALLGVFENFLNLGLGALLGHSVTGATAEDFANALAATAGNIIGVDEVTFVKEPVTATIPAFADKFDAVAVGRGQRGRNGGIIGLPVFGQGGAAGLFAAATWEDGVHYTKGTTQYTVTFLPEGGATVSIPGHSFTAAPGSGTLGTNPLGGYTGRGPGQVTYNGKSYTGGSNQASPGAKGRSPGGGGGGGRAGLGGNEAGDGGDPAAWVRFRASSVSVPDESTGTDTTPPTPPSVFEIQSRSFDSLTFRVGGSTDA